MRFTSEYHPSTRSFISSQAGRILLIFLLASQPACIWKLWSKKPLEERTLDVKGTVETISPERLVVNTESGQQEFVMLDSSIKGSDFEPGAYVHVYYKISGEDKNVTMVVEIVDD